MRHAIVLACALALTPGCVDRQSQGPATGDTTPPTTGPSDPSDPVVPLGFVAFEARIDIAAGVTSYGGAATADFTGDDVLDVAVAGQEGRVSLLVGGGDGTFVLGGETPVSLGATEIRALDVDFDGDMDLVVASILLQAVDVLWNDGNGSFSVGTTLQTAGTPFALALADCNNDDVPDVLVSTFGGATIEIFAGAGDGNFSSSGALAIPEPGITGALVVADVDADSLRDIVLAHVDLDEVVIYRGLTGGGHDGAMRVPVGRGPTGVSVTDVTGDALPELVVSCFEDETVEVYGVVGDGSFVLMQRENAPGGPAFQSVADVSGDGVDDVIVSYLGRQAISVFETDPGGPKPLAREIRLGATGTPLQALAGDVNLDGRLDLVVGGSASDRLNVYLGSDGGLLGSRHHDVGLASPATVDSADFDGDGVPEIVAGGLGEERVVIARAVPDPADNGHPILEPVADVFVGGSGVFRTVYDVVAKDVDADGAMDVVVAVDGALRLLHGTVGAPFEFDVAPLDSSFTEFALPRILAVDDVTADGMIDIVVAYDFSSEIAIAPGNGDGTFDRAIVTRIPDGPGVLVKADFGGIGRPQVAVSLLGRPAIHAFGVSPIGSLTFDLEVATQAVATRLGATDFNDDGRTDLVVSANDTDSLLLLIATDRFQFASTVMPIGQAPTALLTADMNEDGHTDILATSRFSSEFHILLGDGAGGIGQSLVFAGAFSPNEAVLADLNGSGHPDLVVGAFELGRVVTFKNISRR